MANWLCLLAVLFGGGSMLLFGLFLFFGSIQVVHLGWPEAWSLAWNGGISLLFFVQHSTMLRRGFRRRLARVLPEPYHGTLYAVASGVALTAVVVLWQPAVTLVIACEGILRWLVRGLFLLAVAGMAWGARSLGAFDPLGLGPLRGREQGERPSPHELVIQGAYQWVRHPLYLFTIVMIWCNPDITTDRLLFNLLWSSWIYCATFLEEADLVAEFGDSYREYQCRVPRLLPCRPPQTLRPQQ